MNNIFAKVRCASYTLNRLSETDRTSLLLDLADATEAHISDLLVANANDLSRMDKDNPLYDRLQLTSQRLHDIASALRNVAHLDNPLGEVFDAKTLPNNLRLRKQRVPYGVVGVVYEARPNVSFDVFALCFKTGNACVLKGGKDADASNRAIVSLIKDVLRRHNISDDVVCLLPATHEATQQMLTAVGYIDLCIPRGGRRLIDFVRQTARIPVIETGAGVVHTYFDEFGDTDMGARIIECMQCSRLSACTQQANCRFAATARTSCQEERQDIRRRQGLCRIKPVGISRQPYYGCDARHRERDIWHRVYVVYHGY